ncbi:CubicO group peptidase (beta-lactamase class C family) [Lutibacter sp. Hel_I_33_5]|uniref:serine hydrolase domain-containing protein n=1 Tax=Lutibacter sp. Hel_I_33_5 TaxID=1566289 RepID=UPI0011A88DFE|nr:serine hydrolase domain-containing protein [Lutibacter sp. Hel_I_33_5]TVZ55823.1 CubicO group peptidase (beta-lactamase class C family) [Lutibacter sp. Hel_I_33_5]
MKKCTLIFLTLLCSLFSEAQIANKENLDQLFDTFEKENKAMGTVSILKNGLETYQKSFGLSNIKLDKKANEYTKYRIGSITKTFTATIILQLVEEGKLSLLSLVSDYFPQIPNSNKITIKNLLYHRSGLYNITKEKGFHVWISKSRNRKEMLAKITNHKVDFQPNEKTAYSNTNYILLSFIAEKIDKRKFSKILQRRIIKPLNLKRTIFGKKIKIKKNEAFSYYWENTKWNPITLETNLKGPMGAGAIVSTAKEINVFYSNLFSGKLISENSLQKMTTPINGMGMGLSVMKYKGLLIYGHDGGIDGFRSMAAFIPKKKLSIAFTLNASNISTSGTLIEIIDTYFKNDPTVKDIPLIDLKTEDLDKYLGIYSGSSFPLKVTITKKENVLYAQATGQPIFKLNASKKNVFNYDPLGIKFTFTPKNNSVTVKFQGNNHLLTKE